MPRINVNVDGVQHEDDVEARVLLVHYLRDRLGKTGTIVGCDTSNCGSCTVLMDGVSVKSCTVLAVQTDGTDIITIQGMSAGNGLHPVQQAFHDQHGLQCGFCTPGMIMASKTLLERIPHPTEDQIRQALGGNLCRCTGYAKIIDAVASAADMMSTK